MGDYKKIMMKKDKTFKIDEVFRDDHVYPERSEKIPDQLSDIEQQIDKLKNNTWESAWRIGKRLVVIRDKYLKETGYKTLFEYAEKRYDFSFRTAYNFIWLSETFTLLQVLAMGSKLYLLQGLDEKKFANYLSWIEKENPSYNTIISKLKEDKPGRPVQDININRYRLTVNFRKLGIKIKKDYQKAFLDELKSLIERYKDMT